MTDAQTAPQRPFGRSVADAAGSSLPPADFEHATAVVDAALMALSDQDGLEPTPVQRARKVDLEGVSVSAVTEAELVASVIAASGQGRGGWVFTPNSDHLRLVARDAEMLTLANRADVAVADGMPLIWSSRLAGQRLPERVAGSSLIWTLTGAAAATGTSVFLLGGAPGVAEDAARTLRGEYPELSSVGTYCPPFGFERDEAELRAISAVLEAERPDIVIVGLPFPKQERLIETLREAFPGTWFLGLGAAISFVAGETSRAPAWMQRSGLEWVHRLLSEPRRLFRRYVVDGIPYVVPMLLRSVTTGVRGRLSRPR